MYTRRKVFSVIELDGEQRLFSTTETKNFSEEEIADALEAVEDAEEGNWIKRNWKSGKKGKAKVAGAGLAALAAIAAAGYGGKKAYGALKGKFGKKELKQLEKQMSETEAEAVAKKTILEALKGHYGKGKDFVKGQWEGLKGDFKGDWKGKAKGAGKVAIPLAALAAAGYGVKKLVDRRKRRNEIVEDED